jgi:Asp-tRNA(Asn)/Glu-tRNA(Gln) amidotransferase C subunit
MTKLGKLAGLKVSNRSSEFRTSVAQVLDFCATIKRTQGLARPRHVPFEQDVPFEPPAYTATMEEPVSEGGHAEVLLKNARYTQEGFFVAPATRPASSGIM